MKERVFNIFLFVRGSDRVIHEIGAVSHERAGTDQQKLRFLQGRVAADYQGSRRFPLPDTCVLVEADGKTTRARLSYDGFVQLQSVGQHMQVIEHVFAAMKAPRQPLMVITPIVDGEPLIEAVYHFEPIPGPGAN